MAAECFEDLSDGAPSQTVQTPKSKPEQQTPDCVEWDSPTKALSEFLAAVGVQNSGRAARSLIQEFGSLSDLLSASKWRLQWAAGRRLTRTIRASHALLTTMLREKISEGPLIYCSQELVDFLQIELGFLEHERLIALYVDNRSRLMRIEHVADGSLGNIQFDFRAIIGCALAIGATGIVLVHNHPSGDPRPSNEDMHVTSRLKRLAAELDIVLLDHLVVSRGKLGRIQDHWRETRWANEPDPANHRAQV